MEFDVSIDDRGMKDFEKNVMEAAKKGVLDKIGNIRCKEHRKAPKLIMKKNKDFVVQACCDEFMEMVQNKINK